MRVRTLSQEAHEYPIVPFQPDDYNSPERLWERFCANRVEILLSTIRPYDGIRVLWSFADLRRWKYKRTQGQW
jgi:hypothetical protein